MHLQVEVGDLRVADIGLPRPLRRVHYRLRAKQRQQWTHSGVQRDERSYAVRHVMQDEIRPPYNT